MSDKHQLKDFAFKKAAKKPAQILAAVVLGFSLATYLIHLVRKRRSSGDAEGPTLNRERYVFELSTGQGKKKAVIERNGECFRVSLDGRCLGVIWQNEEAGRQWETPDSALEKYLPEIAEKLADAFARKGFPALLQGTYPEIARTEWKSTETLEVILLPDSDIEIFATFLKDEVNNIVGFEEHLDLMVRRDGDVYFQIIGIN